MKTLLFSVLFGGLAGFDEFLQEDILRKMIQWQHIDGCYYVSDDTEQSEGKRCELHIEQYNVICKIHCM